VRTGRVVLFAVMSLGPLAPAADARPDSAQPAATAAAPAAGPLPWFRVFLRDGQVLAILGEMTRVEDAVLLQVPVTSSSGAALPATRPV
jgi:hypothetical protein